MIDASELEALDLAVARALGASVEHVNTGPGWMVVLPGVGRAMLVGPPELPNTVTVVRDGHSMVVQMRYSPSTDWAQAGPIMEREKIMIIPPADEYHDWVANVADAPGGKDEGIGPTPLIAAMRAFVASKAAD